MANIPVIKSYDVGDYSSFEEEEDTTVCAATEKDTEEDKAEYKPEPTLFEYGETDFIVDEEDTEEDKEYKALPSLFQYSETDFTVDEEDNQFSNPIHAAVGYTLESIKKVRDEPETTAHKRRKLEDMKKFAMNINPHTFMVKLVSLSMYVYFI